MGEAKHTPGPWMAAAGPSSVVGWPVVARPSGRSICNVSWLPGLPPEVEAEVRANGVLIAAAPDLLEALRAVLRATDFDDSEPWVVQANSAIAKASGQ